MMRFSCRLFVTSLLVLVGVFAQGCGRPLMAPPTIFDAGEIDPFFELPAEYRTGRVTVYYATDRIDDDPGQGNYGKRRGDTLDLGTCEVQIGREGDWHALEGFTNGGLHRSRPKVQIVQTHRLGDLFTTRRSPPTDPTDPSGPKIDETAKQFLAGLNATIHASSQQELTVFIHGYNTGFPAAIMSCAEYAHYAGNQGAFVCYSWPSHNNLFRYEYDIDSVRYTGTHLRQFVRFLAEHTDAKKINFVCHSSGCHAFGTLLRELRLLTNHLPREEAYARFRIGQVFLVAPDINVDVARERVLEEGAADLFDHLTVYSSNFDFALRYAARNLFYAPRLGALSDGSLSDADLRWLGALDNVTLIDIDSQRTRTLIGHMHQRYNPTVSSDILLMLRRDLAPEQRALTREPGGHLWRFTADYDARIRETVRMIYPARIEREDRAQETRAD
ncbi:MAG: alpha/beta hydrolase [Planctomycetota bacterium]